MGLHFTQLKIPLESIATRCFVLIQFSFHPFRYYNFPVFFLSYSCYIFLRERPEVCVVSWRFGILSATSISLFDVHKFTSCIQINMCFVSLLCLLEWHSVWTILKSSLSLFEHCFPAVFLCVCWHWPLK